MSFEEQPQELQQRVKQLAAAAINQGESYRWFETLYQEAQGQAAQVPWARLQPHPSLVKWLARHSPLNGRGLVIGCGLGDDAEALQSRGLAVKAFDISPTAIAWCRQRFPNSRVDYEVADLFQLDLTWQLGFDLVFECRNLQALPLNLRKLAISEIAKLVKPQGTLLVVTRLRDIHESQPDGPPWPLSNQELALCKTFGLQEVYRERFQEAGALVEQVLVEYRRSN